MPHIIRPIIHAIKAVFNSFNYATWTRIQPLDLIFNLKSKFMMVFAKRLELYHCYPISRP